MNLYNYRYVCTWVQVPVTMSGLIQVLGVESRSHHDSSTRKKTVRHGSVCICTSYYANRKGNKGDQELAQGVKALPYFLAGKTADLRSISRAHSVTDRACSSKLA